MAGDGSGDSVSLLSDGSIFAIGAVENYGNGDGSGHVRVFQLSGSTWLQLMDNIDGEAAGALSGYSVSLSLNGSKVAIVAYHNNANSSNSGYTCIYKISGGT